jgi:peptidoglycan/xylan/chitin deacetylase (PgdA/CDA1 family)
VHVVTLSFDDGFERSSRRTAEIFERFGLSAAINVVARGHLGEPNESWHSRWRRGDFELWNELRARGHEIMPHGYRHANKAKLPFDESKRLIESCLETFAEELDGFDAARAIFASRTTPRRPSSRNGCRRWSAPSAPAATRSCPCRGADSGG